MLSDQGPVVSGLFTALKKARLIITLKKPYGTTI